MFIVVVKIETCKTNDHFKSIIPECFQSYSYTDQEDLSFDPEWLAVNSSVLAYDADIYSAFQYTSSDLIDSYPYAGVASTYLGGGYVFKMRGSAALLANKTNT